MGGCPNYDSRYLGVMSCDVDGTNIYLCMIK
jgi:hypothetical protein